MNYVNNATLIRRDLMIKLAKLIMAGNIDDINRIPLDMFPKRSKSVRCCIHKDRAVIKYRLMALMGHRVEEETDELKTLSAYANDAMDRDEIENPILTVIDEACSACVQTSYFVTNACQGCMARPCMMNCKKNAIKMVNGQAKIDPELCVNCGMCLKECPYHAIIYMPVPCEEACPVGAITKDDDGKEQIDYDKCTFCGKCMRECPFGAIMERSQLVDVLKLLLSEQKMVAMIAPAIVGQFSAELEKIVSALKTLGFDHVIEVALGADMTAEHEAAEFIERMEKNEKFMTTSCCPAYTESVKKHFPELSEYVSDTPTPMHYTGQIAMEKYPDAKRVFIGPCVAKRNEAIEDDFVDYVLTIEELGSLFVAADIDVQKCDDVEIEHVPSREGRGFPASGGVTNALKHGVDGKVEVQDYLIDGLTKKSLRELKKMSKSGCDCNFVEVMACEGGCISGPDVLSNPKVANKMLAKLLERS